MVAGTSVLMLLWLLLFSIRWHFFTREYTIQDTVHNTTFHYRQYKRFSDRSSRPFYANVQRHPFLRNNEYNNNNPDDQQHQNLEQRHDERVCFVHIGKTAGSTLACFLGFRHPRCRHRMTLLPGYLPRSTVAAIHTHFDSCREEQPSNPIQIQKTEPPIGIYLFTIRDPLQRLISWFTYERTIEAHSRAFYDDCGFRNVNQLGEAMSYDSNNNNNNNSVSEECFRMAWRAVTGAEGFNWHNYYNYGYFWERLANRTVRVANHIDAEATTTTTVPIRVAVIRTEHMEQDWWSVERTFFDYEPPASDTAQYRDVFGRNNNNPSRKRHGDRHLSPRAQRNLCAGLCREIQVYKQLLRRAENLAPHDDVAVSLRELAQSCPVEAAVESSDDCPDHTRFTTSRSSSRASGKGKEEPAHRWLQ